ncbi:MAG TPA: universal stress protein [Gemmatimonadaceae bacterium]|jgi:nucleotide-binding universal stress UspA family protein|nr:universal stress protein [Gemmatimonadaceae bacterium]
MYRKILVPVEHSAYDTAILSHVRPLARMCGARVVVMHVADGFAARNLKELGLRESSEIREDREYLERLVGELSAEGIPAECLLAAGDPAREITDAANREGCDLIAMATHGHRFIKDIVYGSVANEVRHMSPVPVLMVRGAAKPDTGPAAS